MALVFNAIRGFRKVGVNRMRFMLFFALLLEYLRYTKAKALKGDMQYVLREGRPERYRDVESARRNRGCGDASRCYRGDSASTLSPAQRLRYGKGLLDWHASA